HGQTVYVPADAPGYVRLYVEKQTGKKMEDFFSKIEQRETIEDALDDVVDGNISAAILERAALEGFKRRKPGRFNPLKQIAHSTPFPPAIVAYREGGL